MTAISATTIRATTIFIDEFIGNHPFCFASRILAKSCVSDYPFGSVLHLSSDFLFFALVR